jgi:hypothetical protein
MVKLKTVDINTIEKCVEGTLAVENLKPSSIARRLTRMYLMGKISGNEVRSRIKKHWIKISQMTEADKEKAIKKMCLEEKPTEAIADFFNMTTEKVNEYVIKSFGGKKETCHHMFYKRLFTIEMISNDLKVSESQVREWIESKYNKNTEPAIVERPTIQEGYSHWVSKIIDRHRKSIIRK